MLVTLAHEVARVVQQRVQIEGSAVLLVIHGLEPVAELSALLAKPLEAIIVGFDLVRIALNHEFNHLAPLLPQLRLPLHVKSATGIIQIPSWPHRLQHTGYCHLACRRTPAQQLERLVPLECQLFVEPLSRQRRVVSELLRYPCILESLVEPIDNRRLLEAPLRDPLEHCLRDPHQTVERAEDKAFLAVRLPVLRQP